MSIRIDLKALATRESEQVEWKENVADPDSVVATITAFANDLANLGGGYVVCGAREVQDEHGFQAVEMIGLTSSRLKEVEGKVLALCRDSVAPPLAPQVEEVATPDPTRRVLVFVVPASRRAHTFRSHGSTKYYVRVSRETREARNGLFRELLLAKGEVEPWDRRPCATAGIDDLDLLAVRDALQRMGAYEPTRSIDHYLSDTFALSSFVPPLCVREPLTGVLRPRNVTVLLFGREPQRHIPGAVSLFSIYPGVDRSEDHSERQEIAGTLLGQARRLEDLLNVQTRVIFDKTDADAPNAVQYPERALREAMVNALAHRDYESHAPTRITVFSDRIEILSPGGLLPGVSADQLREGRASPKWRNQSLAWFLNRLQLAQAEGQGIPTILRTMREEGCPPPSFEPSPDSLLIRLPAHPRHALIREHRAITQAISLGQLDAAAARLRPLVERDPFDVRTVKLFAEVQRAIVDPAPIVDLVRRHDGDLAQFPPVALVHLADALGSMPSRSAAVMDATRRLMVVAAKGRLEEREAYRVALNLLKTENDTEALAFLDRCLSDHPAWGKHAAFLQLRGRANLRLARRCLATSQRDDLAPATRGRAADDCKTFLDHADRDLRKALNSNPETSVAQHIHRDRSDLGRLRQKIEERAPRR